MPVLILPARHHRALVRLSPQALPATLTGVLCDEKGSAVKREEEVPFYHSPKKRPVKPAVIVGIVSVVVIVAVVAAMALLGALSPRPSFEVVKGAASESAETTQQGESSAAADETRTIVVHVGGSVRNPGVYELPESSRVNDAVVAAGGLADDAQTDSVNLARNLTDGEQVLIPSKAEAEAAGQQTAPSQAPATAQPGSGKVNINTATAEALDALPGIGASTAAKIVADREANGPFKTTDDLKRVTGIGDKKYAQLADLITVG